MFTVNYELVCSNILFMLQKADTDNHFTRSLTHRIDLITSKSSKSTYFYWLAGETDKTESYTLLPLEKVTETYKG